MLHRIVFNSDSDELAKTVASLKRTATLWNCLDSGDPTENILDKTKSDTIDTRTPCATAAKTNLLFLILFSEKIKHNVPEKRAKSTPLTINKSKIKKCLR